MNIYFACSITGGREFEPVYQRIVAALIADGHEVPTAYLAQAGVIAEEQVIPAREVYTRDVKWIRDCEALIAEVSVPSHGVGYEIGFALGAEKKVLCLCQAGRQVSKMLTGNPSPFLTVRFYSDSDQAVAVAREFPDAVGQHL